jgi:ribosomal protein L12E/L44/L45/RPP1/RPP2
MDFDGFIARLHRHELAGVWAAYRNARKSFNDVLIAALPEVSMHEVLEARRAQKDAESRAEAAEKRAETAEQQLAQFHSLVRKAG